MKQDPRTKEQQFIAELRELMRRYGVHLNVDPQYDGEDEFCGNDFYFSGDGIFIELEDLERLLP